MLYLTNEKGETRFYQYDRIEKTLQRFEQNSMSASKEEDPVLQNEGKAQTINAAAIVTGILAVIIIILTIALAVVILKNKNEKDK